MSRNELGFRHRTVWLTIIALLAFVTLTHAQERASTLYGQNTASTHFLRSGESFVVVRGAAPDPTATQTWRVGLGRRSFVVPKQSSKSFTTDHIARAATNHRARLNDAVLETLVISFFVIVRQIRRHHAVQRVLTKKNHSVERLALNGSHEAFQVRRHFGRPRR